MSSALGKRDRDREAPDDHGLEAPSIRLPRPTPAAAERSGAISWYISTVRKYVPTPQLRYFFELPAHLAESYCLRQQIRVQNTVRGDGSVSKKRLVDAGLIAPGTEDGTGIEAGSGSGAGAGAGAGNPVTPPPRRRRGTPKRSAPVVPSAFEQTMSKAFRQNITEVTAFLETQKPMPGAFPPSPPTATQAATWHEEPTHHTPLSAFLSLSSSPSSSLSSSSSLSPSPEQTAYSLKRGDRSRTIKGKEDDIWPGAPAPNYAATYPYLEAASDPIHENESFSSPSYGSLSSPSYGSQDPIYEAQAPNYDTRPPYDIYEDIDRYFGSYIQVKPSVAPTHEPVTPIGPTRKAETPVRSPYENDISMTDAPPFVSKTVKFKENVAVKHVAQAYGKPFFRTHKYNEGHKNHRKEGFQDDIEWYGRLAQGHDSPFLSHVMKTFGEEGGRKVYNDRRITALLDRFSNQVKNLKNKGPARTQEDVEQHVGQLQYHLLQELVPIAQDVHDTQDDVLQNIQEIEKNAPFLEPLHDEDLEHSIVSLQVAKDLAEESPSDLAELPSDLNVSTPPPKPADIPAVPAPAPPPAPVVSTPPLVSPISEYELEFLKSIAMMYVGNNMDTIYKTEQFSLMAHDFGTLLPKMFNGSDLGWLNDNIINAYLEILVTHVNNKLGYTHVKKGPAPPVYALKSQWFTSMNSNPTGTARWARPVNLMDKKLLDCHLILIPICHENHWRLVAIKPKERLIEYFDSLHCRGGKYTSKALEWVKAVLGDGYVDGEWNISEDRMSKKQDNASDCGVFTLLNALVLLRGEEPNRVVVDDGMMDARLRVAATLVSKKITQEGL